MIENIVLIAGFAFSAAILYFAVIKLIDLITIPGSELTAAPNERYQIIFEDIDIFNDLRRFVNLRDCQFSIGSRDEIVSGINNETMDLAVLEKDCPEGRNGMNHLKVMYRATTAQPQDYSTDSKPFDQEPRIIDIYYKDRISSVVHRMMEEGVLVRM